MQISPAVDILLVDDREDGLIALEALLGENYNYRLVKARGGHEALALLDQYDFAMILLDVQMPIMDGFETAALVRADSRYRSLPIIFVTAIDDDERYLYRGYEAGAVDYVFKPFDPVILKSKVAVFADLHLKNRQLREQSRKLVEMEGLRRYRNLADSIPHMVLRATPAGFLEYHNKLWSEYTGMSTADSLDTGWQSAIYQDDLPGTLMDWARARRSGTRFESECRIRRFDGAYRWHWIKAEPELNGRGDVIAWLGTCTDIEDRKSFEDQLRTAQRTAEAANDAKTHFLANMSHEIRTPLNAIMGFTELLLDPGISSDEKLKSVSIVRRNCYGLLKIVDEILDISKVEAGELSVEMIETKAIDLLNEVKLLLSMQAGKKGVELRFETASSIPSLVYTDSMRLRQILLNIIGNAIKFTREGAVVVTTRFIPHTEAANGVKDQQGFLQFSVTDTGVGIDAQSRERIFQPFSQADTSTTRLFGGTGLGLALARRLARALGGDVQLSLSEPGEGSTFVITVEVDVLEQAQWVGVESEVNVLPTRGADEFLEGTELKGKRVLLVEDAEDNQFLIRQFLSRTGVVLDIASNGEEGVKKALASEYEVVLMDIQMPFVDGYQATTRLREAGFNKPIIALTAHALLEEREKCLRTGCNGHLIKPINRCRQWLRR